MSRTHTLRRRVSAGFRESTPRSGRSDSRAPSRRLRDVLERHFEPTHGSAYWLERERELGIDARRDLRRLEDLDVFGLMDQRALRERSVWDFVPVSLQDDLSRFVTSETAGTLGEPARTVFSDDEFEAAFVEPFRAAVEGRLPFPRGARWAWIGPGGPHVVGKAARAVCRAMGSPDPFTVDFDPRWFKAQTAASFARRAYLCHVIDQARTIFLREPIEVLFSTPPVVLALASALPADVRAALRGVHLGGMSMSEEDWLAMREAYPRAVFLSGYGNSLLGMCPQLEAVDLHRPSFYAHGDRLWVRVVRPETPDRNGRIETVDYGEVGRVLATRLDESFLIVNLLERDRAVRLPAHAEGPSLGFTADGIGDPRPVESVSKNRVGIY